MNLELKHLTPYLPYDLKGISKDENLGIEIVKGYSTYGNNRGICLTTNVDDIDIEGFLPILRPLYDLTKEIEVNGGRFVPIVKLLKLKYFAYYESKKGSRYSEIDFDNTSAWFKYHAPFEIKVLFWGNDITSFPDYWIVQKLFEWHFDVFGLIPAGLAVDINTIDQCTH